MITATINHSLEAEISTVRGVVRKYDWYLQMGYPAENIRLPSGVTKDSTDEDVANAVRKEYDLDAYSAYAQQLLAVWPAFQPGFAEMKKVSSFDLKDAYEIVLTKYGTGGGYNPARSLIVLRMAENIEKSAAVAAHEIVHMAIDTYIKAFGVPHWHKERLVDLLVERYFPGKKMMQKAPASAVAAVDPAYESSFPDIKTIAKAIGVKNY
ncbi:hypothetical protein HYV30_01220 [Candidatus Kaiserbacteria bacterium]|nr:hypothetical protein [Candidatus Kaiserbacteria bacterium]